MRETAPTLTLPSESDMHLAQDASRLLSPRAGNAKPLSLHVSGTPKEVTLRIPGPAVKMLVRILDEMADGNAVSVTPVHAELTTQEAADMLNVSRPFLIQLLEEGKMRYRKVGTHRRVLLKSLLAYKAKSDTARKAALAELVAYDQELGI